MLNNQSIDLLINYIIKDTHVHEDHTDSQANHQQRHSVCEHKLKMSTKKWVRRENQPKRHKLYTRATKELFPFEETPALTNRLPALI